MPIAALALPVDNEDYDSPGPQWDNTEEGENSRGVYDSRSQVSSDSDFHMDLHLGNQWVYDFPELAQVPL